MVREVGGLTWRVNLSKVVSYLEVLKPRETVLLILIGVSTAVIAGGGNPPFSRLLFVLAAIALGSAGVNGLTNYLDREVDARMERTSRRVFPSHRIEPAEKALPLVIGLVLVALGMAWILHPLSFVFGLVGTITAVAWRKTVWCPFLGAVSGVAPVLVGWFALNPEPSLRLILLVALILVWVPLHVWSIMLAYREDYLKAGIGYFPLSWEARNAVRLLLILSLPLYLLSMALYFVTDFGLLYLVTANLLGIGLIYASVRLVLSATSKDAWKVYKLSAFPYLGLLFLAMVMDLWMLT